MASVTLVGVRKIYQEGPLTRMAVDGVPPKDRNIAMVFQNYALYPHMTAYENMAFGLKLRGLAPADIDARVREAAGLLGIAGLLERRPRHLSGGEQQRVALGRALVRKPDVFLFDEPLSNLDAKLRVQMRREIAPVWERALASREGRPVILGIRPEDVRPTAGAAGGGGGGMAGVRLRLDLVEPVGQELLVSAHSEGGAQEVTARLAPGSQVEPGQEITVSFDPNALHFFDAETRERLPLPTPFTPGARSFPR